ncbi:hypothetical protein NWF32_31225 [Pseudomonas qingdaonensis]|nr:hypothetical protein [Pseudomonas qingdaonensis]
MDLRTKGNKLMKLKLLMSVYRRAAPLAEKQSQGKLNVQAPPAPQPSSPYDPLV